MIEKIIGNSKIPVIRDSEFQKSRNPLILKIQVQTRKGQKLCKFMQMAFGSAAGAASRCIMRYANLCKRLHFYIIKCANYANIKNLRSDK